jgi:hypothetical protein
MVPWIWEGICLRKTEDARFVREGLTHICERRNLLVYSVQSGFVGIVEYGNIYLLGTILHVWNVYIRDL